ALPGPAKPAVRAGAPLWTGWCQRFRPWTISLRCAPAAACDCTLGGRRVDRPRGAISLDPSRIRELRRRRMALVIMPHGRLQEWVAEEKGYFAAGGLEYSFVTTGD